MVSLTGGIDERRVEFPLAILVGTVEAREIREAAYRHCHGITSKSIRTACDVRTHYSMTEVPVLSTIIEYRRECAVPERAPRRPAEEDLRSGALKAIAAEVSVRMRLSYGVPDAPVTLPPVPASREERDLS